ncbi:MAG: MarR family transcriptional regulator [archaeon]|nr:MarR family transcriptional regulator [archaeon]
MISKDTMRRPMQDYALTKDEISAIRAISEQRKLSLGELASVLRMSKAWASRVAKRLEEKGIVEKKRHGISKSVEIVDRDHAQLLAEMIKAEPYIPWEKVLSYSNMSVLLANATGEGDFQRGISEVTRWRKLRNLAAHGLVPKVGNKSDLNLKLIHFAEAYANFISAKFGSEVLPQKAIVIWRKGYSYFFKVGRRGLKKEEEVKILEKNFIKTALSSFPQYGIQFITEDLYYYYAPAVKKLDLEDIILHTLLIDRGSQTYTIYALLLFFKKIKSVNFQILREKSKRYDLLESVENIIQFVDSKGEVRPWPLPKWIELREQANIYGIVIDHAN